jgi:DNA-binding transcriptional LysR family regulator
LEQRLGVKLLVRTTRGLTATEAGLNYYERARRSIEEADEAESAARGAGTSLTGKLRVAAAVTFARIHLMPRLPEFLGRQRSQGLITECRRATLAIDQRLQRT